MRFQRIAYLATFLLLFGAAGGFAWRALSSPDVVRAQQSSATPAASTPQQNAAPSGTAGQQQPAEGQPSSQQVDAAQAPAHAIKAETREVRVDVVVTDKKGNYITDLTQKEFKVYEDNKEQPVNTFSFGGDPAAPVKNQRHYLVLFFDTTSMEVSDQPRARAAA